MGIKAFYFKRNIFNIVFVYHKIIPANHRFPQTCMKRLYCFLAFLLLSPIALLAQADLQKKIAEADKWLGIKDYKKALPLYLDVLKAKPNDLETNFAVGLCYFELDEKIKSLPYFDKASQDKDKLIPDRVHLYLGKVRHLNKEYDAALASLNKYKSLEKDPAKQEEANRYISYCNNAKLYDKATMEVFIQNIGSPINTPLTEYGPVISANEGVLVYTSLKPAVGKTPTIGKPNEVEYLMITRKDENYGNWIPPQSINLNVPVLNGTRTNAGSVGLSPDGQKLLVYMGTTTNTGDIYSSKLEGDKWSNPVKMGPEVNSPSQESSASLSSDEKVLYFASNRPGGQGGMDLYKAEKQANGAWGKPVNLGPGINSKYDEDFPFIHPDGKTLYYTSNGLASMGGQDIFKAVSEDGNTWSAPVNMGAPINTVYNDGYFVLSADGRKGYFASNRPGGLGGADIYFLGVPEEQGVVPLTMMRGRVLAGNPPKPVPTKLKIINNNTKEVIKDVFQPNSKTGDYLIIFPPGQNYDMVVEAQGYKPSLVNIYVPNQNYFYEIYQEIILNPVTKDGKVVGQSVSVKNNFDDVDKNSKDKNNAEVFKLMNGILSSADSATLRDLLATAYEDNAVEKATATQKSVAAEYFYADASGKLKPFIIGSDTLYTLSGLDTKAETQKATAAKKQILTKETVLKPNQIYIVYFDTDKTEIKASATPELTKVYDYLKTNQSFGIKVSGYTDSEGTNERNQVLSDTRAKVVARFLVDKGIPKERMLARGYGSADPLNSNSTEEEKKLNRRVEITLLELKRAK
jgi:outer membrane protein OmpA-like peptidoglycan-associated protein